ncbi:UDP-glucose 6-dehydrogenase [Sulfitobacter sp. THAF37]|uniref:hypothetical protein n=1 Tax=Sulfitobacter sp. THAF37 TaxID=2587855 RepID=UPI001267BEC5|nr:hypothetical protein [Sulfitobacter sp. THAF37]QFT58829.1 UDP-glucose 6-dehydrogenase [Sulfitobacter sp. THAF37]
MLFAGPEEAESIKPFSYTYLARREAAVFGRMDGHALAEVMNTPEDIEGCDPDPRRRSWTVFVGW